MAIEGTSPPLSNNTNNEQPQQQNMMNNTPPEQLIVETASQYENIREQRIKENRERMQKLGIVDLSLKVKSMASVRRTPRVLSERKTPLKTPTLVSSEPPRRSSRLLSTAPVTYTELKEEKVGRTKDIVLETGRKPEFYTEEHEKLLGNTEKHWELFVDGVGPDGSRIYDSIKGKTCHQCRQKTLGMRTNCCKCQRVQGQFCGDCLYMRYGEHVEEANQNPEWICPPCRGICNCSFCRQAKGWAPTGSLYRRVHSLGYKSVAHYLIATHRAPPVSEESTKTPESVKRSLPFEGAKPPGHDCLGQQLNLDDAPADEATENCPQSCDKAASVDEPNMKPKGVGRPRRKPNEERTGVSIEDGSDASALKGTDGDKPASVDEPNLKPKRAVGRPRKEAKEEHIDGSIEDGRDASASKGTEKCPQSGDQAASADEPILKPKRAVGRPRKKAKEEHIDGSIEDGMDASASKGAENCPQSGDQAASADEPNLKPEEVGETRKRTSENHNDGSIEDGSDASASKADSIARRLRPRKRI